MNEEYERRPVLVIDDDAEWLSFACGTLVQDYPVVCTTSADEGLTLAAAIVPGAVVLDVMMPDGLDGFSTFCELRKGEKTRNIPVLMLSQVNEVSGLDFTGEGMKEYLGAAPAAFLEKPISPEALRNAVLRAIANRKGR